MSCIRAPCFCKISLVLETLGKTPFENIVGKGENAGKQHFLLYPQCFLSFQKPISIVKKEDHDGPVSLT